MIELIDDRAMELPPLNQYLAHHLIERARVAETLGAWRGTNAADLDALERILLRVSEMVCELPQLREMDINPIIIDEHGAVAVDARIVIDSGTQAIGGRVGAYSHLPIPPYPPGWSRSGPCVAAANTRCAPSTPTMRTCCRSWFKASRRKAATSASCPR